MFGHPKDWWQTDNLIVATAISAPMNYSHARKKVTPDSAPLASVKIGMLTHLRSFSSMSCIQSPNKFGLKVAAFIAPASSALASTFGSRASVAMTRSRIQTG